MVLPLLFLMLPVLVAVFFIGLVVSVIRLGEARPKHPGDPWPHDHV